MGASSAPYQHLALEPPPLGKARLEQVVLFYSVIIAGLARAYKDFGEAYHDLPFQVRNHALYPREWSEYCSVAFSCSDSREMPDMIQIINMLTEGLARARAAILCDEYSLAISRLYIAAFLIGEAEDRIAKLGYAMGCYDVLEDGLKSLVGAPAPNTQFRPAKVGDSVIEQRLQLKLKWLNGLPSRLQKVEEKTTDSGYNSSRSSITLEV